MSNFTTDGKICVERAIDIEPEEFQDITKQFDIDQSSKWIVDNGFLKVCLQFPDELLPVSAKIYDEIKKRVDVDLFILGDTSYASCCVDTVAAMHVQANAVIHYGHTCLSRTNIPVFIVLSKKALNIGAVMKVLCDNYHSDDDNRLCLFYGAEYEHCKDSIAANWFQCYPKSYMAYIEKDDSPNKFQGRLLKDCNGMQYPVDSLKDVVCIYLGTRGQTMFNYSISVAAGQWYLLDPVSSKLELLEETTWFKRRRYLVEKCKDANVVGILVCKLSGDQTKDIISRMKNLCRINGKKSYIVSVGKPNVAKLANFPEIDIYVMIACPENDLYSNRDFYKPIVYPYEVEVALNSKREPYFTTHVTDFDELLPGKRHHCDIDHIKEATDVSLITGNIRETKLGSSLENTMELETKQNWALENIGQNLQERSWKGLEQNLGETEVKEVEKGREGIPLQYANEPEKI